MHFHHFALQKIADHLNAHLQGAVLMEAFTQEKDQIVLGFATHTEQLYLRVACAAPLPYIWPVEDFHKARRNVLDRLPSAVGKAFLRAETVAWERVLTLHLEDGMALYLKMHGTLSNVLLAKDGAVIDRFRGGAAADADFEPEPGPFETNWTELLPEWEDLPAGEKLRRISPIFAKQFTEAVEQRMADGADFASALQTLLAAARDDRFYIVREDKRMRMLLFPPPAGSTSIMREGIVPALSFFLRSYHQLHNYQRQYAAVERPLNKHLKKYRGQIGSYRASIQSIREERPAEEIGHLLMANLHVIQQGMKSVEIHDFYRDEPIRIKLKPELNAQQNAEAWYQKQKKHKGRVRALEEQILKLEDEMLDLLELEEQFQEFPAPTDLKWDEKGFDYQPLKQLGAFFKQHEALLQKGISRLAQKKHPFLEFRKDGYTILVGKNAKQNDDLTFHTARKGDTWLHARDVTGSHVVIRNSDGKPIPAPVLEYAASLAAGHSKRKSEQLVPVQYTERKYVRKVRNGAPGQVIVDREQVIMVEPLVLHT